MRARASRQAEDKLHISERRERGAVKLRSVLNGGKLETVDTSASLMAQLETMCSSPALVFLFLGLACTSGGLQGLR